MISSKESPSSDSGLKMDQWTLIGYLLFSSPRASWLLLCKPTLEEPTSLSTRWCLTRTFVHTSRMKWLRRLWMESTCTVYSLRAANATCRLGIYNNRLLSSYSLKCLWFGMIFCYLGYNQWWLTCSSPKTCFTSVLSIRLQPERECFRPRVILLTSWCTWEWKPRWTPSTGCVEESPCCAS